MASAQDSQFGKVPELSFEGYLKGSAEEQYEFSKALFTSLKDYGFVILKDHPVHPSLLEKAYDQSRQLFNLSEEQKNHYVSAKGGGQRGYTPFGREHAKDSSVPDLKEFWHVGRDLPEEHPYRNEYPENIWPEEVPEFQPTFQELYKKLDQVGHLILGALAGPLEVDKNYFSDMIQDGNSVLRLLHYPPIPEGVDPRCIRAAAHEDVNLMTILVSASASGLELKTRDGKWLPIETDPSNLIVDSGDMMARITNDVIPATTHRVVNPAGENVSRYSMPFFIHPHSEAMLSCIPSCRGDEVRYEDISAQDFLMRRLKEIGLT